MDIRLSLFFLATFYLISGGFLSIIPLMPVINKELKKVIVRGKFQMRMGVSGLFAGLIFAFFPYDKIIMIGDFLPMLISFIISFLFVIGYIRNSKHIDQKTLSRAENILSIVQVPAGFISLTTGLIHIFFPGIIIL